MARGATTTKGRCRRIGVWAYRERGDLGEAFRTTFGGRVEEWKGAFFQSSMLKWSGSLRLQSPRSAFADTPTRRYADTGPLSVSALPRQ
jgi:hypothetical protein